MSKHEHRTSTGDSFSSLLHAPLSELYFTNQFLVICNYIYIRLVPDASAKNIINSTARYANFNLRFEMSHMLLVAY